MTSRHHPPHSISEDDILRIALDRGLISEEDLSKVEAGVFEAKIAPSDVKELYGPRIQLLLKNHRLSEEVLESILGELKTVMMPSSHPSAEDLESMPTVFGPATTQPVILDDRAELPTCGRFEVLEFIGEGGMGKVYKARDPKLNRHVALKFLHGDNPTLERKFLQEAKQQARVEHSHICKVYEVGEEDDKLYIAMQFIEGSDFKRAAKEMTLEKRVRVMIDVAEAVHAAHREGLIHRDIKPGNIMVQTTDEGWFPFVLDFGLSREMESPSATQSGIIAGTPHYMAPEQVQGRLDLMDRRTDVYALGATLYELVGERTPFSGTSTMDILMNVLHREPDSLRMDNPSFPQDLDTIIMKCLEKDPGRRYDSARAFSEDLKRYLEGDPIEARRAGPVYRLSKKVKKHKLLSGLVGLIILLVLSFAGYELHNRHVQSLRSQFSQEFDQDVKYMEETLRHAYTTPLHDVRREQGLVRERLKEIEARSASYGKHAVGPAGYALGKGYLALNDEEQALEHLQRAWEAGDHRPEVAYALGLSLGERYQAELSKSAQISDREYRERRRKEIENQFRIPAKLYLQRSEGVEVASPDYVDGLISLFEKDYDKAIVKAELAVERVPWLYEAHLLKARSLLAKAGRIRKSGKYDEAAEAYLSAEEALNEAVKVGESDPRTHEHICALWHDRTQLEVFDKQGDPTPLQPSALKACSRLLVAQPENLRGHILISGIWQMMGDYTMNLGKDPLEYFQKAEEMANRAREIRPEHPAPYIALSKVHQFQAEYERMHGLDVMASLDRSADALRKVVELDPSNGYIYNSLGNTLLRRARQFRDRGDDYRQTLLDAADAYVKAIEFNETNVRPVSNLALVYADLARLAFSSGEDPTELIRKSIDAHQQTISANPKFVTGYYGSSIGYRLRAEYEISRGSDPSETFRLSIENMEQAIELRPNCVTCYNSLGNVYIYLGNYLMKKGEDPMDAFSTGAENYRKTIELKPDFIFAYNNLGEIHRQQSIYTMKRDGDPMPYLTEAVTTLKKSIEINDKRATPFFILGTVYRTMGENHMKRGRDPGKSFEEALKYYQHGLSINTKIHIAYKDVARVYLLEARYKKSRNLPTIETLEKGLASIDKSLSLNANDSTTLWIRGELLLMKAEETGEIDAAQMARESILRAVEVNETLREKSDSLLREADALIGKKAG